jgi:hypothetical protein
MNQAELIKIINSGKTKAVESSQEIAKELRELRFTDVKQFSFKKKDISDDVKITNLIKQQGLPNRGKWVYVFLADNLVELLRKFRNKREKEMDNKKFAQANEKIGHPKSVYVGSSKKLRTRMAEHFGKVHDKTYAIRFNEWLPNDEEITCFYFEVEAQSQEVLQALENGMWDNLQPIIGKKGGK